MPGGSYRFEKGDLNPAKRPEVRQKISNAKWQGNTITCLTCGTIKRCMKSRLAEKKYCSRACKGKAWSKLRADRAPHWKGGRTIQGGYVYIYMPDHPRAHNGYISEHRHVMEMHMGDLWDASLDVHHKNGDKQDNRIENLVALTHSEHLRLHYERRPLTSMGQFTKRR